MNQSFPPQYPNMLPVMEQFYTLQGEGRYAGHAAYFIRLSGCDVGCVWCDVKDSWDVAPEQWRSVDEIVDEALQYPKGIVVITGGEPAMYDLSALTQKLNNEGFRVHIETSGAYSLTGCFDWVTVSPKKFKAPLKEVVQQADELKVIVFHKSDFKWAEQHALDTKPECVLLLQPEWSKKEKFSNELIEYIKKHPEWSLSMQTHKYLEIP